MAGLGQMYVADERFKNNIDRYAEGTAEFISEAIRIFCNTVRCSAHGAVQSHVITKQILPMKIS